MARTIRIPRTALTDLRGRLSSAGSRSVSKAQQTTLDPSLRALAELGSAGVIGSTWRVHLGYVTAHHGGIDLAKAREVSRWRESAAFTDLERDALEYAEAMSTTPLTVTDWMVEKLVDQLGEEAVVELSGVIARENMRSRFHAATALQSQGHVGVGETPRPAPSTVPSRRELRLVRPS